MQSSRVVVLVVALAVLLASPALSDVIQSVADGSQQPSRNVDEHRPDPTD